VRKKTYGEASASSNFPPRRHNAMFARHHCVPHLLVGARSIRAQQWTFTVPTVQNTIAEHRLAMQRGTSSDDPNGSGSPLSAPFSRRSFLRGLGTTAVTAAALGARSVASELAKVNAEKSAGPGAVSVALSINGERRTFSIEPRVTLLEVLRQHAGLTGPKEICERATCGGCTVLLDGIPVYACMLLAIDVQGREIVSVEGLAKSGLTPVQQAIVEHDGLQCGYCTPGFVMSLTALLKKNPHPSEAEVRKACSGHLCRCGSYPRVFAAALAASRSLPS
jgi:xanthine dehydrogenase YagT iron-sulfur-binding subunit